MIENVAPYIALVFILTTIVTLILFYSLIKNAASYAVRKSANTLLIVLAAWLLIQGLIAYSGIYHAHPTELPPKIVLLGIAPALFTIIVLFATTGGRRFLDSLPPGRMAYLNTVRIPVELVLFWLFTSGAVPQLMTFEGRNFDIIAGITAPLIGYFGFTKQRIGRPGLLIWHLSCLALLISIVVLAFLSAPSPLQRFAFDQPNIAILYFPFSWLPTFIVPVVLLGHLASIRQLLKQTLVRTV